MNRAETALILKVLKIAYPAFYSKMPHSEMVDWLDVWSAQFVEDDAQLVTAAVNKIVQDHTGYPPGIADVKSVMKEITRAATGEPTDEEYWTILRSSLSDGVWGAKDAFNSLPAPLKTFCGSASWIRDHAQMPEETLDSVVHGQFLKQFPRVREAEEFRQNMPPALREAVGRIFKRLPDEPDRSEFKLNENRNLVVRLLG